MTITNLMLNCTLGSLKYRIGVSCVRNIISNKVERVSSFSHFYFLHDYMKHPSHLLSGRSLSTLATYQNKNAQALSTIHDERIGVGEGSFKRDTVYNRYTFPPHKGLSYVEYVVGRIINGLGDHNFVNNENAVFMKNQKIPTEELVLNDEVPVEVEEISVSELSSDSDFFDADADDFPDANPEFPVIEHMGTTRTAIANAAAAMNAASITAAIKDISENNVVEQHSKIVTGFTEKERCDIANYISKGFAEFEVRVHVKKRLKKGTLRLLRRSIQLFVRKNKLLEEDYSFSFEMKMQSDTQFILKSSNGSSYMCETKGDSSLRDKIMVTAIAFHKKVEFILEATSLSTWTKPPQGWLKLNTFGSTSGGEGMGVIAGLIRDDRGDWVTGFWGQVLEVHPKKHQLEALYRGLIVAKEIRGTKNIIVETSRCVIKHFLEDSTHFGAWNSYRELILSCRKLLKELGSCCKFVLIGDDADTSAQSLARLGYKLEPMELKRSDVPPEVMRDSLLWDSTGLPSYLWPND